MRWYVRACVWACAFTAINVVLHPKWMSSSMSIGKLFREAIRKCSSQIANSSLSFSSPPPLLLFPSPFRGLPRLLINLPLHLMSATCCIHEYDTHTPCSSRNPARYKRGRQLLASGCGYALSRVAWFCTRVIFQEHSGSKAWRSVCSEA